MNEDMMNDGIRYGIRYGIRVSCHEEWVWGMGMGE